MTRHILLDSTPLGLISNPLRSTEAVAIADWVSACLAAGNKLYIPEVIDYELRRELLRSGKTQGIAKLNGLKNVLRYLPITTSVMLKAADLWAISRQSGVPTGDPRKLDIDVILCSQALILPVLPSEIVVATSNVSHISRFVPAFNWTDIKP